VNRDHNKQGLQRGEEADSREKSATPATQDRQLRTNTKEKEDTIQELGGTMPEDLPTPEKSIKQLQNEEQKRLQQEPQIPLFKGKGDAAS